MNRNALWDLIQRYMDDPGHRYPPKPADLARETGVSDQVISKWKKRASLPTVDQLAKFSKGTGIGYFELLTAALVGKGYLPDAPGVELGVRGDWPDGSWLDVAVDSRWGGTRLIGRDGQGRPVSPMIEGGAEDVPRDPAATSEPGAGPDLRIVTEAAYRTTGETRGQRQRRNLDEAGEESQERPGAGDDT